MLAAPRSRLMEAHREYQVSIVPPRKSSSLPLDRVFKNSTVADDDDDSMTFNAHARRSISSKMSSANNTKKNEFRRLLTYEIDSQLYPT
jgi:hypothetical protein